MQETKAIKKFMSRFGGDGHSLIKTEAIIKMGFSEEFVSPYSYIHESGDSYKSTIFDNAGNEMRSMMGVNCLEFAYAIANDIGADTKPAEAKMGRGFQASELATEINKKLESMEGKMKTITQDITFSIDMTTISKEEYHKIIAVASALADGQVNTFTYNELGNDELDDEQLKYLEGIYK